MSGLRFKVGELARIVVAMDPTNHGKVVEINAVGPFKAGHRLAWQGNYRIALVDCDYFIAGEAGEWIALDWHLQKLNPPDEPVDMTTAEVVAA